MATNQLKAIVSSRIRVSVSYGFKMLLPFSHAFFALPCSGLGDPPATPPTHADQLPVGALMRVAAPVVPDAPVDRVTVGHLMSFGSTDK